MALVPRGGGHTVSPGMRPLAGSKGGSPAASQTTEPEVTPKPRGTACRPQSPDSAAKADLPQERARVTRSAEQAHGRGQPGSGVCCPQSPQEGTKSVPSLQEAPATNKG